MNSSTFTLLNGQFQYTYLYNMSGQFLLLPCFMKNAVFNATIINPNQTPWSGSTLFDMDCYAYMR